MLRSISELESYAIGATDGPIGHVKDFYFDDDAWVIRYLVVDTGSWLMSRKVLITPMSIRQANWSERLLQMSITKEQVKNSPDLDTDKPVSRQHELDYLGYYGYPNYWGGEGIWGMGLYPGAMLPEYLGADMAPAERERTEEAHRLVERDRHRNDDPHLRSCKELIGYHIHASDGDIGHVEGLLVDEDTWSIRYMVVNTSNWWLGHKVLVAPPWVTGMDWAKQTVSVDLTRAAIQTAPAYDTANELDRQREVALYGHYERAGYWDGWAESDRHESAM
ncbi:PRC-barrel domain-containing protein [soil metagenome]